MKSIGQLLPWLLASSSSRTPPKTTKQKWQTPYDMSAALRQLYIDLENPGRQFKSITPNIFFSHVTPPTANGTTTWTSSSVADNDKEEHYELARYDINKPAALYLPGLDGYGISASRDQFDDLATTFNFWRMAVLPGDRSSFTEMVHTITDFVLELHEATNQKVTLIGESCGGLLAAATVIKLARRAKSSSNQNPLQGLVMVNPATSFDRTAWDVLVPLLALLPSNGIADEWTVKEKKRKLTPYAVLGSLTLSALVPDRDQFGRIIKAIIDLPTVNVPPRGRKELKEMWGAMSQSFRGAEQRLPAELLRHRVTKWLDVGDSIVDGRLSEIDGLPTLIVVGEEDALMPSAVEGKRLNKVIRSSEILSVKGRGHFVLDDTVNLTEAILYSNIDPLNWKKTKSKYDPIVDWKPPSQEDIETTIQETVEPLRDAFSPVFFSTDKNGKIWKGLTKLPKKNGPLLFVANHQLFALDLRLIIPELVQEAKLFPRGLAHPISFAGTNVTELFGRTPGLTKNPTMGGGGFGDFQMFGAVEVTPRNYYRLMQTNQTVLLFPGGAREALTGNRSYPLFWPDKQDFVRTAAKFNATIVPLSALGMADSASVLLELKDVARVPFLANRLQNFSSSVSGARYDRRNESDLVGDIVAPSMPARNYFLFGKPIDTTNIDPKDLKACEQVYNSLKSEVREGLDRLMEARKKDPFADTPKRVLYERTFGKHAPTFPIDELNSRRV